MTNIEENWQSEAAQILSRLHQIAPRTANLYKMPECERHLSTLRRALTFWEMENEKDVRAMKKMLGIKS